MSGFFLLLSLVPAGPALTAEGATAELGDRRRGPTLTHRFLVSNRSPAAVTVTDLRPSCGCLKPQVGRKRLGPGESTEVVLEVNTLSQPLGSVNWRVAVRYRPDNGPEAELPLVLTANLFGEVLVEPAQLALSSTGGLAARLTVTDKRAKPLRVTAVRSAVPHVEAKLLDASRSPDGAWTQAVEVRLAANCPPGHYNGDVVLTTDDRDYVELKVPVSVTRRAKARVTASPSVVSLRPGGSAVVQLIDTAGEPVKVEAVECEPPTLDARWAAGPGARATVRLQAKPGTPAGDVTVRVNLAGGGSVEVPAAVGR